MKVTRRLSSFIRRALLVGGCVGALGFGVKVSAAPSPFPMSSGNYSEGFDDIANWTDGFAAGNGANRWAAAPTNTTGTIPDGVRLSTATDTFKTGTSGGVQRGTAQSPAQTNIVLLSTGSGDNSSSAAIDLYLDFTGVNAGTLSFDWTEINNTTGNRAGTVKVYTTTDGTTFSELTAASVTCTNNTAGAGTISGVALPAAFNNSSTARIRFYYYNGGTGPASPSGSRPKIGIDNIAVTKTGGGGGGGFIRVETKADGTGVIVPAQNVSSGNSLTVYAIQRDASSNFVANVAATSWSLAGASGGVAAGDLVAAGDAKSATFTGHVAGTAKIRASGAGLSSVDSGLLTVVGGAPTQVRVETAADGSGTIVPADTVVSGQSVVMYAVRRDAYSNYVDNVAATAWSLSAKTGGVVDADLVASADKKSATFTGNGAGTATVRATSAALTAVDSGVLTVTTLPQANVVISQVYGGGGNSGSIFTSDYVELFNRTANPVSLNGWSIQYASSAGAFQSSTTAALPNASVPAHGYYLIQLATTNAAGNLIPTPDFSATNINMSATAGKVALANTTTALGTITWPDARVVDMIGYGGASAYEGAGPAPTLANGAAGVRNSDGCSDTDNNSVDFVSSTSPTVHNSSSAQNICQPQPPNISAVANQSIDASAPVGPLTFNVGDQETPAANLTVTASSSNPTLLPNANISLGGSGVVRNVTLNPVSGQTGVAQVTLTVTDMDNMTASTTFTLFVGPGPQVGMLFAENFDSYADGTQLSLLGDSMAAPWFHTSGTFYEMIVSNHQAQVCLTITNSEDVYGQFTNVASAGAGTVIYVGFKLTQTTLPNTANGEYFLHFKDNTTSNFFCRVFASTVNAAAGKFRLGLSNKGATPPNVQFPRDLDVNTTYNVVARYKVGVGVSTLWVDPASFNDTSVTATDTVNSVADIYSVALRETGSGGNNAAAGSQSIDNIAVSTSFTDVVTLAPQPPVITATRSANSLTLTWPVANGAGFTLQTASTVNSVSWTTVPGVTTSGGNYTVTVPFTSTPAFFRLKK